MKKRVGFVVMWLVFGGALGFLALPGRAQESVFKPVDSVIMPALTYDQAWLTRLTIEAPAPGREATCMAEFRLYAITKTGPEFAPRAPIRVRVPNLFARSATNETMGQAMQLVFAALLDAGREQGVLQ